MRPYGAFIKGFRHTPRWVGRNRPPEISQDLKRVKSRPDRLSQVREQAENLTQFPKRADDRPSFRCRHRRDLDDRLGQLLQAEDGIARVEVVVHRRPESVPGPDDERVDRSARPRAGRSLRGVDRCAHRVVLLLRPREAGMVVLDVFAVWGLEEAESDDFPREIAQDLTNRDEVPEALRHLLALECNEAVVHPRPGPLPAPRAFADHRLALVMRELQVDAAAMDVEGRAEVLVRHRIALDVPARTAVAPRAGP